MKAKRTAKPVRREPKQRRARQTVDAVLDAVARLLKRDGFESVTTNHIAELAGVSIGSVYQYFPDKAAIYSALLERHVEAMGRLVERALVDHAESSLDDAMRALIEAMIEAHAADPVLHEMLGKVPHRTGGAYDFDARLRAALRLAISSRAHERRLERNLDEVLFALAPMIESLAHGAVLRRPPRVSLSAAKEEAVRAVLVYLRA